MFNHPFSPVLILNLELSNRLIKSSTTECLANDDGSVSQALRDFYVPMAQGGVAMIIIPAFAPSQR